MPTLWALLLPSGCRFTCTTLCPQAVAVVLVGVVSATPTTDQLGTAPRSVLSGSATPAFAPARHLRYPLFSAQAEEVASSSQGQLNPDVWATKPAWCQPWTIVGTGTAITAAPWLLTHSPWWTFVVAIPILAWWYLFLLVMPMQYRSYAEEVNKTSQ